ncbi:hypothetical protein [Mycoplasma sp. CSL10166]|uniref:hypothetical protein n=1 Tax=Mycoplasma sp. CSL10166 TaxID=2813825 RepID=UPI00197CA3F9|nr:hypothetical protein [Mycoplasma sp. CSL10166]MBN4084518.1 hypothetical protein [Mycoplasma sp. CSL10166]
MIKNNKKWTMFTSSGLAAIVSISTAVTVVWSWYNQKQDYKIRYEQVKNILDKLKLSKENIVNKFKLIDSNLKTNNQFKQLDQIVEIIINSLKNSIKAKENVLKNLELNRTSFLNENEMMDYNDSLDYIIEFDKLINEVQDINVKNGLISDLKNDTSTDNSKTQLSRLKEILNNQEKEINENKVSISTIISSLPEILRNKFNEKLNDSQDNLSKLKELKDELDKYVPVVNKAKKIKNLFKKSEVFVDLDNSTLGDLNSIEDKIDEILRSENLSEFDRKREQVRNLIDVIDDEHDKNNFIDKLDEINNTKSMNDLISLEKEVENYLKSNSGIEGLINYKKNQLSKKVNDSDLSDGIKHKYTNDILNSTNLDELTNIEKEVDDLISLQMRKKEVEEVVKLLNNPKKDELLGQLSSTNELGKMDEIYNEATNILSDETEKTKNVIKRLKGLTRLKNDYELNLSEAKTQFDIQKVASNVKEYMDGLIDEATRQVESLDENITLVIEGETVNKKSLKNELISLNKNGNAGEYSKIIEKASAIKNYVEAKSKGSDTSEKLNDKEKAKELKEKLQNAKSLDEALKAKAEIDRLYQFQLDKEEAKIAINKVKHTVKKEQLTKRWEEATTSDELILIKTEANSYHDAEEANKLTHDELVYFVDENINDLEKKNNFKAELDSAMNDSNNQPNINQDEIEQKLRLIRDKVNELIKAEKNAAEALRLKKEQIKSDILKIQNKSKANEFNGELIDIEDITQAEKLQEKVDKQLEFEKKRKTIDEKVLELEDKKDYSDQISKALDIEQLKEIETKVDEDLKREAQELKEAKDAALDKIVDIADSNPLKGELFEEVEKSRTKSEVAKIIQKVDEFLGDLRTQAIEAIETTKGDDTIHSELNDDLGGAKNEVLLKDIIRKAGEAFGDKKSKVIDQLDILDETHPSKEEFKQRLKDAKNISELDSLLTDIRRTNDIENVRKNLTKKLEQVQEESEKEKLAKEIEDAANHEQLTEINRKIDAQIQKEKDEIKANKDIVNEKIKELYKDENIKLFNDQIAREDLTLDESRKLIKNIDTTIAVEQNELKNKIDEATKEINDKLLDSSERNDILLEAQGAKNLVQVDQALSNLDQRIEQLKDAARAEANKLLSNNNMLSNIDNATTQEQIDEIKNEAIKLFEIKKQKVLEKLNATINVSQVLHDEIESNINNAENESNLNELSALIDEKLSEFNLVTEREIDRLVDKSIVISKDNWTSERISQGQRDVVKNKINEKWQNYIDQLTSLEGDDVNHKKYEDILSSLNKEQVNESTLDQYIHEMKSIFDSKKTLVESNLETLTNEEVKSNLTQKLDEAKKVIDLNKLEKEIELQHKKEELIESLKTKIVFEDQIEDFKNRINEATEIEQLINSENGLEKQINDKQAYNNELLKEIEIVKSLNKKINVTTEKFNEFNEAIEAVRTNEKLAEIKSQINDFISNKKSEVTPFIEKLVGSNEKTIKENELSDATSESEINSVLNNAKELFSNKQNSTKTLLESLTDEQVKKEFETTIDNAENIRKLDEIKDQINNQKLREEIQKGINKLTENEKRIELQNELNDLTNDRSNKSKLQTLKSKVDEARQQQEGEFVIAKEQAQEALNKLLQDNPKRIELQRLLDSYDNNQTDLEKVKTVKINAEAELLRIRNEAENTSSNKIQPRGRDTQSPTHLEKYNDFARELDSASNEKEINDIVEKMDTYINQVRDLYKKYVTSNLSFDDTNNEILTKLDSAKTINTLDQALKDANKKSKDFITNLVNTIEDNDKKQEFLEKIHNATNKDVSSETPTKWRNELEVLKDIYDQASAFKNNENRELSALKQEVKNKIETSLNDNPNDTQEDSKAKLLELIDSATTKAKANEVLSKLNAKISGMKQIAATAVEKIDGSNLYNSLKEKIDSNDIDTEEEILSIQKQAIAEFAKVKKVTEDAINLVDDQTNKNDLISQKDSAENIAKLNEIKNDALIKAKKEDLKKIAEGLWGKKNYNNEINSATTLDRLNEIESQINNDKRVQDEKLRQAKEKALEFVDKLEDKTEKENAINAAKTLEDVKTVEDQAKKIISDLQGEITELLKKIEDSENYNLFKNRNTPDANETTLKQLKTDLNDEFDRLKKQTQNKINEPAHFENNSVTISEYKDKELLLTEANNATNYRELHKLENTSEVNKLGKYVSDEIKKVLDKGTIETDLNNILATRPNSDEEKEQKISALNAILERAKQQSRKEYIELETSKEEARKQINEKLNSSTELKNTLLSEVNNAQTKDQVDVELKKLKNHMDTQLASANAEIAKLTENKEPRNGLNTKLSNAISETEIANVKNKAITELEEFKNNAQEDVQRLSTNIEGQNNYSEFQDKLETAKSTNTQEAYEEVVSKVNEKIEKLRTWAKTKLEQVANDQDKESLRNQIEQANTSEKLKELENLVSVTIAREAAKTEINKLSSNNDKKGELLAFIESSTSVADINSKKDEAITMLNAKKTEAKNSVAKLEGDNSWIKAKTDLKSAQTEDELNTLIATSDDVFNTKKSEIKGEIDKLIEGNEDLSVDNLNTIKDLKNYHDNQIIAKAKEYTKVKINQIDNATKKEGLSNALAKQNSVDKINEIYNQAMGEIHKEDALNNAKTKAITFAETKLAQDDANSFKTKINEAPNIEEVNKIRKQIETKVNDKLKELTKLKSKFLSNNAVRQEVEGNSNNSIPEMEKSIKKLETEKARLSKATKDEIEKIHLTDNTIVSQEKMNSENQSYNQIKNELNEISDWTEEQDNIIISKVSRKLIERKSSARQYINSLTLDDGKRNELLTELDSRNTDNLTKIIKLEQKADREAKIKSIKEKINQLHNDDLRRDYNQRVENENENLVALERDVNQKLEEQKNNIRLAREAAQAEVNKLPNSEQSAKNIEIENATTQAQLDTIKQNAITRMQNIRVEVQNEINKMPENARSELNSEKNKWINNGNNLLTLKQTAINTVTKSNELTTKNNNSFANEAQAKTFFASQINSSKANNIAKINTISSNLDKIKTTLQNLRNKQNQLARQEDKTKFNQLVNEAFMNTNKEILGNNSLYSTLNNIISKIDFRLKQDQAINDINTKLTQDGQNKVFLNRVNNLTNNDEIVLNNILTDVTELSKSLNSTKELIDNVGQQTNRIELEKEWNSINNLNNAKALKAKVERFKAKLAEIQADLNGLDQKNPNKSNLEAELNEATTVEKLEEVRKKIRNEKIRINWIPLKNRLNDDKQKREWDNTMNDDNSTIDQMNQVISLAEAHLNEKRTTAERILNKINEKSRLSNKVSDTNSERDYDEVIESSLNILKTVADKANVILGKLKTTTKSDKGLPESYTFNAPKEISENINETTINNSLKVGLDIWNSKILDARKSLPLLEGDRSHLNDYSGKIGNVFTNENINPNGPSEEVLDQYVVEINRLYSDKRAEITNKINSSKVHSTIKSNFNTQFNAAKNLGALNSLSTEISKYDDKINEIYIEINKVQNNSKKETFKTQLSQSDSLEKLNTLLEDIKQYNTKWNIAKTIFDGTTINSRDKKVEFIKKLNDATTIEQLDNLIDELKNYFELRKFQGMRDGRKNSQFFVGRDTEKTGVIEFNEHLEFPENKFVYIVLQGDDGSFALSDPIKLNSSILKFRFSGVQFAQKSQQYNIFQKIFISNSDKHKTISQLIEDNPKQVDTASADVNSIQVVKY